MPSSRSSFATQKASQYLQQLCKHFAHKVDVTYDKTRGQVVFPLGRAELTADDAQLTFHVETETEDGLARCKFILEDHITRFAFREDLHKLHWSD